MIDIRELLSRLEGVTNRGGGQYMACCPAHHDRRQSLAVRVGDTGNIVINCRAGCPSEDVLEKLGLTMADITVPQKGKAPYRVITAPPAKSPEEVKRKQAEPKKPKPATYTKVGDLYTYPTYEEVNGEKKERWADEKITHAYEYTDEQGTPLMRVFRTPGKQFPVIHYADGKWWKGDGGHKEAFYRLPELCRAIKGGNAIYIPEGEKDVDNLWSIGLPATTNKGGAAVWPAAYAQKILADAVVYIIADNDEPGQKHAQLVAKSLDGFAKEVRTLQLKRLVPDLPEHGDVSDVIQLLGATRARAELPKLAGQSAVLCRKIDDSEYADYYNAVGFCRVQNGCICTYDTRSGDWKPLCNFVALPVEEIDKDNGLLPPDKYLKIVGWDSLGNRMRELTVAVGRFANMGWALEGWGLAANIYAKQNAEKLLRSAIQEAGHRASVKRTIYTHTGWRLVDGKPIYLHGSGAIGAEGVGVELEYGFDRWYDLRGMAAEDWPDMARDRPEEKSAYMRLYAIYATQACMDLAPRRITAPLIGLIFLSPLCHFFELQGMRPSFVPFVRGKTGTGKSTIAALLLGHFGRRFSYEGPKPANFSNSAGAISRKLFVLKDMPLLLDDYHPEGDPRKKRDMDSVAQAVDRMIGDGATRSRMKADTTAQTDIPARGLCVETGEDLPDVKEGGIGRLYVIDIRAGEIDLYGEAMRDMWQNVWKGVLSETMRGYIEWLRGRYAQLPKQLSQRYTELQKYAAEHMPATVHKRMPTAIAYIMLGLDQMLDYFISCEAILPADKESMLTEYWDAVLANSQEQQAEMQTEQPTEIYLNTLRELLISGKAVVVTLTGTADDAVKPMGMIGYRDKDCYYLNPGMAYGAVQRACAEQGGAFPIGKNMLHKMLREEGKILPDPGTGKNVRQLARGPIRGWMLWVPRYIIDATPPPPQPPQQQTMEFNGGGGAEDAEGP